MGSCLSSGNPSTPNEHSNTVSVSTKDSQPRQVSGPSDQPTAAIAEPVPASSNQISTQILASFTKSSARDGTPPPLSSFAELAQACSTPSDVILAEHIAAGRPRKAIEAQDRPPCVYSDTVEIEPVVDHAVPADAQIPSATATPAGNVLLHLNRAMILQNRMAAGAMQHQLLPPRPLSSEPMSLPQTSASQSSVVPHTAGPVGSAGASLASFVGNVGSGGGDDSAVFDAPVPLSSAATGAGGSGAPGLGGALHGIANQHTLDNGSTGVSLNGMSVSVGATQSSSLSTFASGASFGTGAGFGTPLHGLCVEATLSEMQQMALIGSGGGGCVYIGRWRGVTVAVKFIVSSNDDQLTRSQREALLSRLASHPHVVQTYATSVTQLTEQMFKAKDGVAGDALPPGVATADPNISHDVLAGLTSGSWIRGELQMALNGAASNLGGPAGPGFGAPLPTIVETTRSSPTSMSASASGQGVVIQGAMNAATYESDGQLSSSSVSKGRGQSEPPVVAVHHGQNDPSIGVSGSAGHSCTSAASSGPGANTRLLHTALNGTGPRTSAAMGVGSAPVSFENPAVPDATGETSLQPTNSGGCSRMQDAGGEPQDRQMETASTAASEVGANGAVGAGTARPSAAAPVPGTGGQQSHAVADSFDASFVRDHLGRAKYSIHEVLRQLGAHEGQFLTMVVMEYCDGGSLLAALKEGPFHRDTTSWSPRMLLRATVRTALEIAHGMQHLHLSGLVHGDLKPGNVLLKGSNQDKRKFVAKVSDLGIAHPVGTADEMAIDDGQIGSIAYMAPEVFRGRIMKASDVYSFGVLLWQLVCGTGAAPYEGAHPLAIALGVSEGKMTLRWPPGVFRPLQQLGDLCTQADPAARPSFKSVVGALEKLERHMQRLAAAAAAGSSGGGGSGTTANVSLTSPASSITTPVQGAPTSGILSAGLPTTAGSLDKPQR